MKDATEDAITEAFLTHFITPLCLLKEMLMGRGSNCLLGGFANFLKARKIKKLNTLGYHPKTNGKNEKYKRVLESALFKLNLTGDPWR